MGAVVGGKACGAVKMGVRERPKPTVRSKRGSKWLPKWPKVGSKWLKVAQNGPKWLKIGPKWLKVAENGGQ